MFASYKAPHPLLLNRAWPATPPRYPAGPAARKGRTLLRQARQHGPPSDISAPKIKTPHDTQPPQPPPHLCVSEVCDCIPVCCNEQAPRVLTNAQGGVLYLVVVDVTVKSNHHCTNLQAHTHRQTDRHTMCVGGGGQWCVDTRGTARATHTSGLWSMYCLPPPHHPTPTPPRHKTPAPHSH